MLHALVCKLWVVTWRCCVVLAVLGCGVLVVGVSGRSGSWLLVVIGDGDERGG